MVDLDYQHAVLGSTGGFLWFVPCQIATPPPYVFTPRPKHLVNRVSSVRGRKPACDFHARSIGMASKTLRSPAQPVRLTDPEDVFCKAIGLDINDHNDGLLLSQVKVRLATGGADT